MDNALESLRKYGRPAVPPDFGESLGEHVRPLLKRRRRRVVARRAAASACAALCLLLLYVAKASLLALLPTPTLLRLAEFGSPFEPELSSDAMPVSFPRLIEEADLFVYGRLEDVSFDKRDLAQRVTLISCPSSETIRATVRMNVLKSHPPLDAETLTFATGIDLSRQDFWTPGTEYLVALRWLKGAYHTLFIWPQGIYPVDAQTGRLGDIPDLGRGLTVEEAWEFILDAYGRLHGTAGEDAGVAEKWRDLLHDGGLPQSQAAIAFFSTLPNPPVTSEELIDAMQRHYPPEDERRDYGYREFLEAALSMLERIADEHAVDEIYDFFLQDMALRHSAFDDPRLLRAVLRLVLKHPGPVRRARLVQLLTTDEEIQYNERSWGRMELLRNKHDAFDEMVKVAGKDIDQLFLDMIHDPQAFGFTSIYDLASIWRAMAQRGMKALRPELERILADPEHAGLAIDVPAEPEEVARVANEILRDLLSNLPSGEVPLKTLLDRYDAGDSQAIHLIRKRFPADGRAYIPWLQKARMADVADLIAHRAPDPCFIPLLEQALDANEPPPTRHDGLPDFGFAAVNTPMLLYALHACGARQEAVDRTVALLQTPPISEVPISAPKERHLWNYAQVRLRTELLKIAAFFGDSSAFPAVEHYLEENVLEAYYDLPTTSSVGEEENMPVNKLHRMAVLAVARLGGEAAAPILRKQYQTEHPYIQFCAALGLLYLGDESVRDELKSLYPTNAPWEWTPRPNTVHTAALLRSPAIDALYIERLRNGMKQPDGYLVVNSGLAQERPREVLPLLVDALSGRYRDEAVQALRHVTGQSFGFDAREIAALQGEAIAEWRRYVEELPADEEKMPN